MAIWAIQSPPEYNFIIPVDSKDWLTLLHAFKNTPVIDTWTPIPVRITRFKDKAAGDFFPLPASLPIVVNNKALKVLLPLLAEQVEVLPLNCKRRKLSILNPLHTIQCVDIVRSDVVQIAEGNIVLIKSLYFEPGCIDNLHIFRTSLMVGAIFVSDEYKRLVESHSLRGTVFTRASE